MALSEDFVTHAKQMINRRALITGARIYQDLIDDGFDHNTAINNAARATNSLSPRQLQTYVEYHSNMSENADFDYRKSSPDRKKRDMKISAYDFSSKSSNKVRYTGNYADNALDDPSRLNEDGGDIEQLHNILTRAGIADDEIVSGIKMSLSGKQKIAGRMGISEEDVQTLLYSLQEKLKRNNENDISTLVEQNEHRFAYEDDSLGNVTVRDAYSGKSVYLPGFKGTEFLKKIKNNTENDQLVMSRYAELMEETDDSYSMWEGKHIVWEKDNFKIAVNTIDHPNYYTVWTDDNKQIGHMSLRPVRKKKSKWMYIESVEIDRKYRNQGLGMDLYRVVLQTIDPEYLGLYSYLPNVANKKQVPAIHRRLGGVVADGDEMFISRKQLETITEDFDDEIADSSGTYNFPWKIGNQHGTATAEYSGKTSLNVRVIDVRDNDGDTLENPSNAFLDRIKAIAIDFIGKE